MSVYFNSNIPIITICVASLFGVVIYHFFKKNETDDDGKNSEELNFVKIGKIGKLFIYPVKSMKGISVPYIECNKTGASYNYIRDRSFMVVDRKTSLYIGGGKERKLTLIQPSMDYDSLTSSYILTLTCEKNKTFVTVNLDDVVMEEKLLTVKVIGNGIGDGICEGYDCGDEVGVFIKNVLSSDADLRLIYHSELLSKKLKSIYGPQYSNTNVTMGPHELRYHCDAPYHILTEGSLNDLNKRYKGKDQMVVERFRPVIVVSNTKPYDEDYWRHLKVGKCLFEVLGPCVRCIQTTIDPKTAEKHPNMEPVRELRKYRLTKGRIEKQYGISPVFGIQASVKDGNTIKVGDDVLIHYKKIQH
uniref:MOSC domain-containing protein n=1 Tax=Strongyloides venezuelensis TaxID=75913 RepID=A0A0K0FNP2_STRVS